MELSKILGFDGSSGDIGIHAHKGDINRYFTVRLTEGVDPPPAPPSNGQLFMIFFGCVFDPR